MDEKSQIQALECTQPVGRVWLDRPEQRTHDYLRHGTTTASRTSPPRSVGSARAGTSTASPSPGPSPRTRSSPSSTVKTPQPGSTEAHMWHDAFMLVRSPFLPLGHFTH